MFMDTRSRRNFERIHRNISENRKNLKIDLGVNRSLLLFFLFLRFDKFLFIIIEYEKPKSSTHTRKTLHRNP